MMAYENLISQPSPELITLAQAKLHLRVDFDDDNDRITRHIIEAREWVETRIQKKVAGATWEIALDEFPSSEIELTISPVNTVSSVKYDDAANVEQTLTVATNYTYSNGIIYPVGDWPSTYDKDNAVRIRVVTGYSSAALIPSAVIAAMYLKIKELYDGTDADVAIHRLLTNSYTMVA